MTDLPTYEFTLDTLPPEGASQNSRKHYRKRAAEVAEFRRYVRDNLQGTRPPKPLKRARLSLLGLICRRKLPGPGDPWPRGGPLDLLDRHRALDTLNFVGECKPLVDAMVDLGILEGDRHEQVKPADLDLVDVGEFREEGIWIRVEELPLHG